MAAIEGMLRDRRMALSGSLTDTIVSGWLGGARSSLGLVGAVAGSLAAIGLAKAAGVEEAAQEVPSLPELPDLGGGTVVSGAGPPPVGPLIGGLGPEFEFPALEHAVRQLTERKILAPEEFYSVADSARRQAFTISGGLTDKAIEAVRGLLAENLTGPASREGFVRVTREQVDSIPISDAHLEQVFRNNANEAYSLGMEHVLDHPLVGDLVPYAMSVPIHDTRTRPEHLAIERSGLNGTAVFNRKDPVWITFRGPWSWGCRCGWIPLTVKQAAARGVKEAQLWLETGDIPTVFEFVDWPTLDGKRIMPDPSWQRVAIPA